MGKQEMGKAMIPSEERIEQLTGELETARARINELERKIEELERLSTHDPLTGILDRRGGREEIELIAAGLERGGEKSTRKFSVLLLDIDDFKAINDTYGHDIGDLVIKNVAEFLKKETRRSDVVARWGGEEFLVALQNADAQDVINMFFDTNAKKSQISLTVKTEKGDIRVALSGGSTDYMARESLDNVVARADEALYESKKAGKNMIMKYREPGHQGK